MTGENNKILMAFSCFKQTNKTCLEGHNETNF